MLRTATITPKINTKASSQHGKGTTQPAKQLPVLPKQKADGSYESNFGEKSDFETLIGSRLNSSKGGGSPLANDAKSFMESRFGSDFSRVKVHTDSDAVQMNKELNAQAFTHGNDVYFNRGRYDPNSSSGKHLLAHELTHTIQQGRDGVNPTGGINLRIQKKNRQDIEGDGAWYKKKGGKYYYYHWKKKWQPATGYRLERAKYVYGEKSAEKKKIDIELEFNGKTLFVRGSHSLTIGAHSGLKSFNRKNRSGIDFTSKENLKKYQHMLDTGPVPEGVYKVKKEEVECHKSVKQKNTAVKCYKKFDKSIGAWGFYRSRLYESFFTSLSRQLDTSRTGGFFLHGDSGDGTAGCIGILSKFNNKQLHYLISNNDSDEIKLVVKYPEAPSIKKFKSKRKKQIEKMGWEDFTTDFILYYSREIRIAARKYGIHPVAIAGVVAWEREENPRGYWSDILYQRFLCEKGWLSDDAGIGYGSIHLKTAEKIEKETNIPAAKNSRDRCKRLIDPVWAVRYIAAFMSIHKKNYLKIAGVQIGGRPEILATLFHTGKSEEKAKSLKKRRVEAAKKKKKLPVPMPDEMGRWVRDNRKNIEFLLYKK